MADIVVTTPKSEMDNAAAEAAHCIKSGGGYYFRRLSSLPQIAKGDRVFYIEDGIVTGFALVDHILTAREPMQCEITGHNYAPGVYVIMRADSWKWIKPIPTRGFQGFRYFKAPFEVVGDWKAPKPATLGGARV